MQLRHILAATDESEAGRQAVRCAVALSAKAQARITVLRVMPEGSTPGRVALASGKADDQDRTALGHLRRWLEISRCNSNGQALSIASRTANSADAERYQARANHVLPIRSLSVDHEDKRPGVEALKRDVGANLVRAELAFHAAHSGPLTPVEHHLP